MLGPPLFLSVMHARLHFVKREHSMAASGLYDGPLFLPAVTVVCRPSCTLQTWPEQHVLIDVTVHVRELFLAKRRQLNVITCLSTRTVNMSCSVYTLAGSQRLIQDEHVKRRTTLYVVWMNLRLRTTSEGTLSCTTTTTRHTSASQLARDPVDAARGKRFLISRPTIIVRLPSSSTWQAGSTAAARLPPSVRRRLSSSVRHPPASTSHHRPVTGQSHVMFLFAAALLCFSSIP